MLAQKMTLRPHTIYAIVLCLLTATLAPGESAATTPLRGKLWVTPVEHLECAGEAAFVRGESVLLTGSGFAADETVRITFLQGDSEADVASATVKKNGSLQGSVAIPVDADAAQTGKFRATGDVGDSGKGLILTSISLQIFAGAGDVDGDGAPDICDNCIDVANGDLLDDDGDGIGDACDKCPADRENDADRDGLCADVDPDPWAP